MIPYILYASLILTACLVFYKLLLQKETFFHLNRIVLLTCMALAFTLPLLPIPQQISFRKIPATISIASAKPTVYPADITPPVTGNVNTTIVPVQKSQIINSERVMQWIIYLY